MELNFNKTQRGFGMIEFTDRYHVACNIQMSSLATESAIWFGCADPEPKALIPGKGWTPVELPPETVVNTRMHLTQDQVKDLLPILQHFAKTGELPRKI